jgi:transcriptional regulator with XRE-family HTH domain
MALWSFLDYRTGDEVPRNLIQTWYGQQTVDVQAEFDATVATLAATEDWRKAKEFKLLKRKHLGLAELRFSVKSKKHGKGLIRKFRPVGIWREEEREFVFLLGCEKARGAYTPPDAFDRALDYLTKLGRGEGDTVSTIENTLSTSKLCQSKEYREAFVSAFLKRYIPFQIRTIRKKRGMSQPGLAKASNITQGVISRAEDADNGNLTINTVLRIAAGFDLAFVGKFVRFSELLKTVDEMSEESLDLPSCTDECKEEKAALTTATSLDEPEKPSRFKLPTASNATASLPPDGGDREPSQPLLESAQPKNNLVEMKRRPPQSVTPQTPTPLAGCGEMR